jgi:peptidoglycan/xylan/chitin deacetylase (PgdA/CDA1 family)
MSLRNQEEGAAMTRSIPILSYHSVSEGEAKPAYRPYVVDPHGFEQQMAHLRQNGYASLTVTDFIRTRASDRSSLPERPIVITFDDGLEDFYSRALPILNKYGLVATLYIVTGLVGHRSAWLDASGEGGRPMLTWSQISEISAAGIECGAHSHSHPELDTLSRAVCRAEIVQSKECLEARLGRPVTSFAYPYGLHGPRVRQMVRDAGFASACAVKHAMSSPDDDPFSLARISIRSDVTIETFSRWLEGHGLRTAPRRERPRTTVWRYVRRAKAGWGRLRAGWTAAACQGGLSWILLALGA